MRSPWGRRSRLILASGSCRRHEVEGAHNAPIQRFVGLHPQESLEDQFVDLTVSVEAVGLQSVVGEYVDGVANHQRTADAAVGPLRYQATDLGESICVGSQ